ncbi:hypothetical protein [Streptomyces sp. JJ38]|uniref:hypothetical protein n=1 Tax=Streptomyces sp. JJ38 TaxID=2738128 RepID=UPI001C584A71|nr:hypothetical protein [Streptomyces sp. JJ38]MBW1600392.1 hypothetical protein [Streptomyces sp. JJ38]
MSLQDFLFEATKDPRVKTRLQETLASLDEGQRERMRQLSRMGGHAFIVADVSDLDGEESYAITEVRPI